MFIQHLGHSARSNHGLKLLLSMATFGIVTFSHAATADEVDFARDVLPVLSENCLDCHGPDEQESRLRLDSPLAALSGGDTGEPVIAPGNSDHSYLLQLVTSEDPNKRMPPDSDPLPAEQIQILKRWIDAKDQWTAVQAELDSRKTDHWSFQPIVRPAVPENTTDAIDALIQRKLSDAGLSLSSIASRRQLIRRLYFVMLGIPPTPSQVDRFVNDPHPQAWENLVEHVLDSPHYGEKLATAWLDLVRFGETHGFETNRERPNAWHYRDWVVSAFNNDKPYDQFIREQIAGDALGEGIATGFLVAGPYDLVKSSDKNLTQMQRQDELADILNTTGTAFMGLTLGCARCHNHKFDAITQSDYYAMQAVFAGVKHGDRNLPLSQKTKDQIAQLDIDLSDIKDKLTKYIRRPGFAHVLIDDEHHGDTSSIGLQLLKPVTGTGTNPAGIKRGFASDPGSSSQSANFSGGKYSWWQAESGDELGVYRPFVKGQYRVWLSWGCGWDSHCTDVRYAIDRDGDIDTKADRVEIANVNQRNFADGSEPQKDQSLWSGFYNAGVHQLAPRNTILIHAGQMAGAVTADVVFLEPISGNSPEAQPKTPSLRPAVTAKSNVESFPPTTAKFVRFTIHRCSTGEPCIDELEVYSGSQNVALTSAGAKATSGGDFVHALHKLSHINDGQYGNPKSWIAKQTSGGWVQIEFASQYLIDRVAWARDRTGKYGDRVAVDYVIEASQDAEQWTVIASSMDRLPFGGQDKIETVYDFADLSPEEAKHGKELLQRMQSVKTRRDALTKSTMVYAGTFSQPAPTHRLYRGEPSAPREQVSPAGIRALTELQLPSDSPEQQRRLAVANWIADPKNPLTARVIVNRLWQHHFGTGIVDTPSDFGGNGTLPSHPDLLDWLASELIDSGWSLKHIQRLILLSHCWQQDSRPMDAALAVDAGSRLLWRFPPRRMHAESIRDAILSVSGNLNLNVGGQGFSGFEVQPENVRHYFPRTQFGPDQWRRMLYMTRVRQERESVFGVFDCPDFNQVVAKRSQSTTPLQALNLFNSPFVLQQAAHFASRLEREASSAEQQVTLAYQLCFGRLPTKMEVGSAVAFINQSGLSQFTRAMLNANEFIFIP